MAERFFILDGMALVYRAYFSMIRTPLINSKGVNTSAIFGFINTLNKIISDEKPEYIGVAFDTEEPTFRHQMYKEYKGTREAMPDDLVPQIGKIKEVIMAYNIPLIEMHGFEADDIIGTLARIAEEKKILTYIVSPDKDLMQLVTKYVTMYKPARSLLGSKVTEIEFINEDKVVERYGVKPDKVIDVFALIGDKVDNVPGVKGIGEKTAVVLLSEYGSLDELYKNVDKIAKPKLKENLITHKKDAYLSRELVTIDKNIPIKIDFAELKAQDKNLSLLEKLLREFEFKSLLKKLITQDEQTISIKAVSTEAAVEEPEPEPSSLNDIKTTEHKYYIIKKPDELKKLVKKLKTVDEFSFDTETTDENPILSRLVGMSFCYNEHEAFYIPVLFAEKQELDLFGNPVDKKADTSKEVLPVLTIDEIIKEIKPVLENKNIRKIGHNIKYDILVMKKYGVNLENVGFDSMIGAYILNPESQYKMDFLSEVYLNYHCIPISDLISNKPPLPATMDLVPFKQAAEYAAEDADITLQLYHRVEYELKKIRLDKLCYEVEFPLIEVLADMEFHGVRVDEKILNQMNTDLAAEEKRLEKEIYNAAGETFNINSPKQLSDILFDKLKLPPSRKGKTFFSTDINVLEELKHKHKIVDFLLEFRTVNKIRTTYTEGLLKIINKETGKVHTSFNQYVAATGRLSSANPNLQNIPIRTETGKNIRKAFLPAEKNCVILSADYSQIELRIMAHLSNDENMINAFEKKRDIHKETASRIFKVKPKNVDANMRRKAKEVNFGLIYGIQAFGLASRLDIDQKEAREIIERYFREFPSINTWLEKTKQFARDKGYTETIIGRRRYLQNINNKNSVVRQRDERVAINMPVQGTAADMIKIAMINIHNELKKEKLKSKMILQVHDELVFECPLEEPEELERIVINKMKHALKLNVPIEVDVGKGKSWFEAHD